MKRYYQVIHVLYLSFFQELYNVGMIFIHY